MQINFVCELVIEIFQVSSMIAEIATNGEPKRVGLSEAASGNQFGVKRKNGTMSCQVHPELSLQLKRIQQHNAN